ncbi:PH domain-containing protein [Legionella sp. km772]|uniref:PH domain-containing protein n=1 Tax=Legionella sp. km772 TaxID=2498111 RepID=UPI000F8EA4E0|nr:PH domain-containing protein [Legionella sp. km772]RUR13588.1 PH domain-containing protein [Legionella sp. km772]
MTENLKETDVLYFTRLHWIIFFWPIVGFCVPLALQIYFPQLSDLSLFLLVFALLWLGMTWVTYYFSSITIKKRQVILRTGIIVRQTVDMPLSKIETIDIRQSILGSIFQYGALIITGTGGTRHLINYIHRPLTCRRYIEQLMNAPQ